MIGKINIRVSAANPQMPLGPFYVFTGSAASFTICDIPLPLGVRKVQGVTVRAKNVDGEVRGFAAVRVGSAWGVTVPVGFFSASGSVGRGIVIEASGSDDNGQNVEPWIIGAGDLHVMLMDGSIEPGETTHEMHWHDVRPANPAAGDVAPYNGGGVYYFNGTEWIYMGGGGADVLGKLPLRHLPKYLHYLPFDDTYPADAQAFYDSVGGARVMGGCSIVRKGGLVGGNFDYPYDDACSFAIKVSAGKGANADGSDRHASVGAAYLGTRLKENIVSSGVNTPLYRVLPGMTESGINDAGVYAKINVIPRDESKDPAQSSTRNLHALAVVRYVLDNFDNANDAARYVALNYYIPEGSHDSYHWMIADNDETYIVEDGTISGVETILTNHRQGADNYGSGYSRDGILSGGGTVEELLAAVKFTNAYATGWPWPDEFAGQTDDEGKITHDDTDRLKAWAEAHVASLLDANRKPAARGNGCWQTVHSCIYDFERKTMAICVQEDFSKRYVFAVDQANVDLSPIEAQIAALQSSKLDKTSVVPASPSAASGTAAEAKTARNIADTDTYGETDNYDWTWSGGDDGGALAARLNVAHTKLVWDEQYDAGFLLRDAPPGVDLETFDVLPVSRDTLRIHELRFIEPGQPAVNGISATRTSATKLVHSGKLLSADNQLPASGSIAKFGVDGKMLKAEPSGTSQDPANADYRDPQDNTCHKTEFGEWVHGELPYPDIHLDSQPEFDDEYDHAWVWLSDDGMDWIASGSTRDSLEAVFVANTGSPSTAPRFTATRSAVCTDGKKFVTEDVAAKQSDIFGSDGKPTDTFAGDILGKQVAISAMHYALNSGATIQDRAINLVTMTDTRQTITLPSRIVGKTRDLILRVEVGDLATIGGIALALGSTELASWEGDALDFAANKNYLVTVTETKNTAATDAQDAPTFFVRVVEMTAQPTAA